MTRTSARRGAALGAAALGAVLLGAPTAAAAAAPGAATLGTVTVDPLTGNHVILDPVTGEVIAVVDPLSTPLDPVPEQVPAPVGEVVKTVTEAVTGTAPEPEAPAPESPAPGADTGPAGSTDPTATSGPAPAPAPASAAAPATPPTEGAVSSAAATGGSGTAFLPGFLSPRAADMLAGGFGSASNPMSLFGAPRVANIAPLLAAGVPAPRTLPESITSLVPAGGSGEAMSGALVALACGLVAAAAAGQVSALRTRRAAVTA